MSGDFGEELRAAQRGDREAAGRLLEQNTGLIWSVARRYFGRGAEAEDLYQLGCLGFLKAVEGFDPAYGTQFSTYAVPKIAGEIRRFLRDDGMLKVSRTIKERAAQIHMARTALEQRFGSATILLISHRITTLSKADQILVLDRGRIVEQGDHETLSKAGGVYQKICEIQSASSEEVIA